MKCEECQMLMEECADGVLDHDAARLVDSHVAACADCANFYSELNREQEIYARYQRDVDVTPVLWSSIEARIKQERQIRPTFLSRVGERLAGLFVAPRLSPGFAAALVMIAIGITVGVMTLLNSRGSGTSNGEQNAKVETPSDATGAASPGQSSPANQIKQPEVARNDGGPGKQVATTVKPDRISTGPKIVAAAAKPTPDQLVHEAEQKYLAAIAMLSRDVKRHRSQLDPIMLARFDAALGDIDRTIKDTRRVVHENPGDPVALQYLLAAYSKKVDVLREMTLTEN